MVSATRPKKLRHSKRAKKVKLGNGLERSSELEAADGGAKPTSKNSVKRRAGRKRISPEIHKQSEDTSITRALQEAIADQNRLELHCISLVERERRRLEETLSILEGAKAHASELQEELRRERERNVSLDEQKRVQGEELEDSQKLAEILRARLGDAEARTAQVNHLREELGRDRERNAALGEQIRAHVEQLQNSHHYAETLQERLADAEARAAQAIELREKLDEQKRVQAEQLQVSRHYAETLQQRLVDAEARAAQVNALREERDRERGRNVFLDEQTRVQAEQLQNSQHYAEALQQRLADAEARAAQVNALREELDRERKQAADLDEKQRLQVEQLQRSQQYAQTLQERLADAGARAAQVNALREELDRERRRTADLYEKQRLHVEQLQCSQQLAQTLQEGLADAEARAAQASQLKEELEREHVRGAHLDQDLRAAKQRSARLGSIARRAEAELAAKGEEIDANVEALAEERRRSLMLLEELDEIRSNLSDEKNRNADLQRMLSESDDAVRSEREALAELHSRLSRELQRIAELEDDLKVRSHEFDTTLAAFSAERDSSIADRTRLINQLDKAQEREKREKKRGSLLEQEIRLHQAYQDELRTRAEQAEMQLTELAAAVKAERATVERLELEIGALRQTLSGTFVSSLLIGQKAVRSLIRIALFRKKMSHPLFDPGYYLENYPDVREADLDPFLHYLRFGAPEGRNPNRMFDTKWYLEQYPDVKSAGANPLIHYFSLGASEGRDPHPLFSTDRYVQQHPELEGNRSKALAHYLQTNDARNRLVS